VDERGSNGIAVLKYVINLAVYKGLFPNFFSAYDWVENVGLVIRIGRK
jgi:hypothetical protein